MSASHVMINIDIIRKKYNKCRQQVKFENIKRKTMNSKPKGELRKKAGLLKQKIITNSNIMHNTYEYRIQQLLKEQDQWKQKINELLIKFTNKMQEIQVQYKSNYAHLTQNYSQSQNSGESASFWTVSVTQLKKYLNTQKNMIKQLLQMKQEQPNTQVDRIHKIVKKKHFQQLLEQVQIRQLEKQIKYLSTHVINSSGLIYIPENTISEAEQQELSKKIELHLSELERLIELEVMCGEKRVGENEQKKRSNLISALQYQQKRLSKAFDLLKQQKEGVQRIQTSIQQYAQISRKAPIYNQQEMKTDKSICLQKVSQEELTRVLNGFNLDQYGEIVSNQTCSIQQLNNNIKTLRARLKKLE